MITCAQCGKCCKDINSPVSPEAIKELVTPAGQIPLSECWTYMGKTADGRFHYVCRYFNGKTCDVHDRRPDVCRGFPFYGKIVIGKQYLFPADCAIYKYYTAIETLK